MVEAGGDPRDLLPMLTHSHSTVPDPDKVQKLVDMGFEKEKAE